MFRCTECNKEYENKPDYCDCGNDAFIEVSQTEQAAPALPEAPQMRPSSIFEQNSLNPESVVKEEVEEEKFNFDTAIVKKKKITVTCIAISLVASLFLLLFVGNDQPRKIDDSAQIAKEEQKQVLSEKIPDVDTFWDDSLPFKSSSGSSTLPLLNDKVKSLDGEMRAYMVNVGKDFYKNWSYAHVKGAGECIIEFTIDKNGLLDKKKIAIKSDNESLNDSVLMTLSKVANVDAPPQQYKGERIRLTFFVDENGKYKMFYP